MTRAPRGIVERVAEIPGVRRVEGSIRQYATLDLPGERAPARALVNSLGKTERSLLNRLTLRAGRLPDAAHPGEVVADEAFLEANGLALGARLDAVRSEEHTSELQSLMRISYAVFCLKKKKHNTK